LCVCVSVCAWKTKPHTKKNTTTSDIRHQTSDIRGQRNCANKSNTYVNTGILRTTQRTTSRVESIHTVRVSFNALHKTEAHAMCEPEPVSEPWFVNSDSATRVPNEENHSAPMFSDMLQANWVFDILKVSTLCACVCVRTPFHTVSSLNWPCARWTCVEQVSKSQSQRIKDGEPTRSSRYHCLRSTQSW